MTYLLIAIILIEAAVIRYLWICNCEYEWELEECRKVIREHYRG